MSDTREIKHAVNHAVNHIDTAIKRIEECLNESLFSLELKFIIGQLIIKTNTRTLVITGIRELTYQYHQYHKRFFVNKIEFEDEFLIELDYHDDKFMDSLCHEDKEALKKEG